MKNIFHNLTLLTFSVLVTFIGLEAALRATDLKKLIPPTYGVAQYYYEMDETLGFDIAQNFSAGTHTFREGSYPIFSTSYRCFDRNEDLPDNYILLLGDSFTWGYASFENKYGTVLENLLGRTVAKCGISGTGTKYQLDKAQKVIDQAAGNPGLIIVGYTSNDFHDDFVYPAEIIVDGYRVSRVKRIDLRDGRIDYISADQYEETYQTRRFSIRSFIQNNSIIANIIWNSIRSSMVNTALHEVRNIYNVDLYGMKKNNVDWVENAWNLHTNTILEFKDLADRIGAQLIFVLIPDKSGFKLGDTKTFLSTHDIQYVDLFSAVRHWVGEASLANLYWPYDGHFNVIGNEFTALVIAKHLFTNGIVAEVQTTKLGEINSRLEQLREQVAH